MAMVFKKKGEFLVSGSKHKGQSLRKVAEVNPNYLNWIWTDENLLGEISAECQDELEKVMVEFDIPLKKLPKKKKKA